MFFILSKTAAFLLFPSNVLILLALAGLLLMATRYRRGGGWLIAASVILLAVAGFSPLGKLVMHPLETRFPRWDASHGAPDGIIILGGPIDPDRSQRTGEVYIGRSPGRIFAIARLARQFPSARIVYSGGSGDLMAGGPAEADYVYPLLDEMGVPRARVTLENRSRNTAENAVFTKEMVQPKPGERWLLVTSAEHMPRAVGCFRQAGFRVEAYPVDRNPRALKEELAPNRTFGSGLDQLDYATREWIGLVAYRLTGRTSALFPGPAAN